MPCKTTTYQPFCSDTHHCLQFWDMHTEIKNKHL